MNEIEYYMQFRSIAIYNINIDIKISQILELFVWTDIESYTYYDNIVVLKFFNYNYMYRGFLSFKEKDIEFLGNIKIKFIRNFKIENGVLNSYMCGGTRGVFITQIEEGEDEKIKEYSTSHGRVEQIKYFKDRKTVYVVYEEYSSAVNFLEFLLTSPIYFSKKCGFVKQQKDEENELDEILHSGNRTLYIGNFQAEIEAKDILDKIKIGMIHNIKILRDKKIGFITFIDCMVAKVFLSYCEENPLVIKNHKLKVTWGKSSTISLSVVLSIFRGASRILRIDKIIKKEALKKYGEIEYYNAGEYTVVGYFSIIDAIQAYKELNKAESVRYMRDRCDEESLDNFLFNLNSFKELEN